MNEKKLVESKMVKKKNNTVYKKEYERVITRKQVWDDDFELEDYQNKVRVIRSKEEIYRNGKINNQEIYVVTNMLKHDVETILKIMHLRWNIELNGFRTIKQRYNLNHIFIGNLNAINYIFQMTILAFNLLELYVKVRLKEPLESTWGMITRILERDLHSNNKLGQLLCNYSKSSS